MNIHFLQHVPFEDAANVGAWACDRGHAATCTRMDEAEPLPPFDAFDWLVVLGGPMNVDEHEAHPWLVAEKRFLAEAIQRKKHVLGICLGAQLAAAVLGGRVTRNPHKEIGWRPVELTDAGLASPAFDDFPEHLFAFHWHGDTFSIPPGADRLAETSACTNQAFEYDGRVLGLQFHLDYSVESIEKMLHHCSDELVDGPYVQSADAIRASFHHAAAIKAHLFRLLDNLERYWAV